MNLNLDFVISLQYIKHRISRYYIVIALHYKEIICKTMKEWICKIINFFELLVILKCILLADINFQYNFTFFQYIFLKVWKTQNWYQHSAGYKKIIIINKSLTSKMYEIQRGIKLKIIYLEAIESYSYESNLSAFENQFNALRLVPSLSRISIEFSIQPNSRKEISMHWNFIKIKKYWIKNYIITNGGSVVRCSI